jgi:hypothetical protein
MIAAMQVTSLRLVRADLMQALATLGVIRRRRFASIVPVWLNFDSPRGELTIVEARGGARAVVKASGAWSPAGATLDMFGLRRVLASLDTDDVELIADASEILIPTKRGHVRLKMQPFGPESGRQ